MADKRKPVLSICLSFLTILLGCIGLSNAAWSAVETEPRDVLARVGESINLMCKSPQSGEGRAPLGYCRFEIPGRPGFRVGPGVELDGVSWFGDENGLAKGECGISVHQVNAIHDGQIKCLLGLSNSVEELTGTIDVTVAVPPRQPKWVDTESDRQSSHSDISLQAGQTFSRLCVIEGGRPSPNITFYIGSQEITDPRVVQQTQYLNTFQDNTTVTSRQISYQVRAEDDGKTLTCRAVHSAYPDGYADIGHDFRIVYGPVQLPEQTIYGVQFDRSARVTVTIQANPEPNVIWLIDHVQYTARKASQRYTVEDPMPLQKPGMYNVTLIIDRLTPEDINKVYYLKAKNSVGEMEYTIHISPTGAPIDSSLDIGALVGIIVAGVLIIVVIGLLIVARATGRWCFAGASHNTDIGPDSEAQISNPNDEVDEKTHEQYHPDEHTIDASADEKLADKQKELNGKHENGKDHKTNTSV